MSTVTARHKITGIVADIPEEYLDHPVFGQYLEVTDEPAFCADCELPDPLPAPEEEEEEDDSEMLTEPVIDWLPLDAKHIRD
mgnify:CR=1 FL=1